jgi:hypothetical protein
MFPLSLTQKLKSGALTAHFAKDQMYLDVVGEFRDAAIWREVSVLGQYFPSRLPGTTGGILSPERKGGE